MAAKNVMASVPDYLLIETAFTCAQWVLASLATGIASSLVVNANRQPSAGQ